MCSMKFHNFVSSPLRCLNSYIRRHRNCFRRWNNWTELFYILVTPVLPPWRIFCLGFLSTCWAGSPKLRACERCWPGNWNESRASVPFAAGRQAVGQQWSECREGGHNLQSLISKIQQDYKFHIFTVILTVSSSQNNDYEQLATGWTIRGSNPMGGRFSATVQTGPGDHPSSYAMGTGCFTGVKWPGRGVDHPTQLTPRLKKE
jgi:hypothetical protein